MNTIDKAQKVAEKLINNFDSYASVYNYSTQEMATVNVHKYMIHIFSNGIFQIRQGATLIKEYKTTSSAIKKVVELIYG